MSIFSDIKDDINHLKYRHEQKKIDEERAEYVKGVLGAEAKWYSEALGQSAKGEMKGENGEVTRCIHSGYHGHAPYTISYFQQRICEDGTSKLMSIKLKLNPDLTKEFENMTSKGENLSTDLLYSMLNVRPEDRNLHRICMAEMDKNGDFVKGSEVMFAQDASFDKVDAACDEFNAVRDFFKQLYKQEQNSSEDDSETESTDSPEITEE